MARCMLKLKEKHKTTFFSPSENWCLFSPSTLKPEERDFVVDSRASMHMISKMDLNSAELETVTTSRSQMTVITANGEVQTNIEATVYVRELDIFWTMKILNDTPAVLSLGKLCDEHGYSYDWINGQKQHISFKMVFEYSAIRKISYQSWFLVYLQLLQAHLLQHPRLLQVWKMIIQITIQQSSQVKLWIDKHGQTCSLLKHQKSFWMNQPKSQNQIKMRITNRYWETFIQTYQIGCKNSERTLWMKEFLNK